MQNNRKSYGAVFEKNIQSLFWGTKMACFEQFGPNKLFLRKLWKSIFGPKNAPFRALWGKQDFFGKFC